jgi:hypothetical protein
MLVNTWSPVETIHQSWILLLLLFIVKLPRTQFNCLSAANFFYFSVFNSFTNKILTVQVKTCSSFYIQWGLGSRTPLFTYNSVHEQIFRMTNGFSDYEHASWQQRQAESISARVSCWLTLVQYTSLLDFGFQHFGSRTASRNGLSSWTEAPLYYVL